MCAVIGDTQSHRFLIASNSHKRENEVHLINYSEDSNRIDQEAIFSIDNGSSEIWSIASSPYNKDVFVCGLHSVKEGQDRFRVGLYDMCDILEPSKDFDKRKLKTKLELGEGVHEKSNVHSVLWED